MAGKSRNPTADLPFSSKDVLADFEMVLVSHLHPDHFDIFAQRELPKDIQIYCQPGDEHRIKEAGFANVEVVDESVHWYGVTITRRVGQHGNENWAAQMGAASGFVFRAKNEPTIYWTSDTIWCKTVRQVVPEIKPDIILTHSSGAGFEPGEPTIMDVQQTIEVCRTVPQAIVIAIHMETFDFDTVTRKDLRAMAQGEGIEASQLRIPADGETLEF